MIYVLTMLPWWVWLLLALLAIASLQRLALWQDEQRDCNPNQSFEPTDFSGIPANFKSKDLWKSVPGKYRRPF